MQLEIEIENEIQFQLQLEESHDYDADCESITSSYIGSLQDFLIEHGPYPGWEYEEAFVTTAQCQFQIPLVLIPSSPEPPSSSYTPSNASSIRRNGLAHGDEWSQDSDGHLHARSRNQSSEDHPASLGFESAPSDLNPWDDVPIENMQEFFNEHDEEDSEVSSHPSLREMIWESKPRSCAKRA